MSNNVAIDKRSVTMSCWRPVIIVTQSPAKPTTRRCMCGMATMAGRIFSLHSSTRIGLTPSRTHNVQSA